MINQAIITHGHFGRLQITGRRCQGNVDMLECRLSANIAFTIGQCIKQCLGAFLAREHGLSQINGNRKPEIRPGKSSDQQRLRDSSTMSSRAS
ncbi:hypothetical protein D3C85_1777370 [compost metagenome]